MLKPGTIVAVEWCDAYMGDDDKHTDGTERFPPAIERTVGYVVRDDRHERKEPNLVVAMSMHDAEASGGEEAIARHRYRDRMVIPAGMLRKVRRLVPA